MEDSSSNSNEDETSSTGRWTCEACGCNTNSAADRSCSICGTASGLSVLRRAGYAARAGLFARGFGGRPDILGDGADLLDFFGQVVQGAGVVGDDGGEAMAALAGHMGAGRNRDSSRQRLLEAAARSFSSPSVNTQELMLTACDNAASFRPKWANPSHMGWRGNSIEVGDGERQCVAHLPIGAGEGRPIRSLDSVPRNIPFSSLVLSTEQNQERRHRRSFGFRMAFDHQDSDEGASLGGNYLVGVTTSSFTNFGEPNALQQSPYFWGVDDAGNIFSGGRRSRSRELEMNSNNVLFGSREVVTVVVDIDTRSMTFYREETTLGTLIDNLPRGSTLYPVAVPFKAGCKVAITGMDGSPTQLLRSFNTGWKEAKKKREEDKRGELLIQRAYLIKDGCPTPELEKTLGSIFSWYTMDSSVDQLNQVEAARLWCRCELKQANLDSLLASAEVCTSGVTFGDFMEIVRKVTRDDEGSLTRNLDEANWSSDIEIGDKVELVKDYQTKGDARNGPLQPGDRGTVIDMQKGPNGQRHSIRVLYAGRRWWYQPRAVISERSGLIETSAVWWLRKVLRKHGFDHTTFQSFVGDPVTSTSWEYGDIVIPRKLPSDLVGSLSGSPMDSVVGRIVPFARRGEGPASRFRPESSNNDTTILVEFVHENFAKLVGLSGAIKTGGRECALATERVKPSELVHSTELHGTFALESIGDYKPRDPTLSAPETLEFSGSPESNVSPHIFENVKAMSNLDLKAIESIASECKKRPKAIASLFSIGLNKAILDAVDKATERARACPKQSLQEVVHAIVGLIVCVAKILFSEEATLHDENDLGKEEDHFDDDSLEDESMDDASADPNDGENQSISMFGDGLPGHLLAESGRLSTLQQRRSVLLALMSRSRRSNVNSLNDLMEREEGGADLRNAIPGYGSFGPGGNAFFADANPNAFGDGSWDEFLSAQAGERPFARDESQSGRPALEDDGDRNSENFLWSVYRGSSSRASRDAVGALSASLSRCLSFNSVPWMQECMNMHSKVSHPRTSESRRLRGIVDVDGIPLLLAAISLGSSVPLLRFFIECGVAVGEDEVRAAAHSNQPSILTLLLQHATFADGDIDPKKCTSETMDVVEKVRAFQEELRLKMSAQSSDFMSKAVCRMLRLALFCRSNRQSSTVLSSVSETLSVSLAGHALVGASQQPQNSKADLGVHQGSSKPFSLSRQGLFDMIPVKTLADALFSDSSHLESLLLLIEDHFYSKDISDSTVALTLLSSLVGKFPFIISCSEIDRYGFRELVASHNAMASRRIAESPKQESGRTSGESSNADGSILCPAKHVAVLHITRHSSFRCDICGKGVERGKMMHGCRVCDWDACSHCTDSKTTFAKNARLLELSKNCGNMLCKSASDTQAVDYVDVDQMLKKLALLDNTSDLQSLSIRLQQRDNDAAKMLAEFLSRPGTITTFQFSSIILPSLHIGLLGKIPESERSNSHSTGTCHRKKKARVVGEQREGASEFAKHLFDVAERTQLDETCPNGNRGETLTGKAPEIVRRLQKILSYQESVARASGSRPKGALKSLAQPITIHLLPSSFANEVDTVVPCAHPMMTVQAEPLVPIDDIERQILLTCKFCHPAYQEFCERLVEDQTIVIEQSRTETGKKWRVARVISFNQSYGFHVLQYALPWNQQMLEVRGNDDDALACLQFEQSETRLILAAREYYIIGQGSRLSENDGHFRAGDNEDILSSEIDQDSVGRSKQPPANGSRVKKRGVDDQVSFTVLASSVKSGQCCVVSDAGVVSVCTLSDMILASDQDRGLSDRVVARATSNGGTQDTFSRGFPFLSARNHLAELSRRESERAQSISLKHVGVMKRTWSAISLREKGQPIEVNPREEHHLSGTGRFIPGRGLCLQTEGGMLVLDEESVEVPPLLRVAFSMSESLPSFRLQGPLIGALKQLRLEADPHHRQAISGTQTLYFTVKFEDLAKKVSLAESGPVKSSCYQKQLNSCSGGGLCEGLDEHCVLIMEVLGLLAELSNLSRSCKDQKLQAFENVSLSKRVAEELDDPLTVVGGAMPDWCLIAPIFAPRLFTYNSRRLLLNALAFGMSRSTLFQQSSKVQVDRLRERMASLRARAVDLVNTAINGHEDPTALQLQADELYGMEEALAGRVKAAFRAEEWEEHALDVAKAAVHREKLLVDAENIMERLARNKNICNRRLEVRFENESGFDAGSGSNAGVTRGFYADIAEALVSAENNDLHGKLGSVCLDSMDYDTTADAIVQIDKNKLPMFIPDTDSSSQVIIPTPRSDPRSVPGVYPRPLSPCHPQMTLVLERFRFIGRLFAAAMRDGFMFPLPLSSSFLKLVQHITMQKYTAHTSEHATDELAMGRSGIKSLHLAVLDTSDLPRPGFLGGEIYGVDMHVCRALDLIDASDPPLSQEEANRRYKGIAADKSFARAALGKAYDCSFEEFFEERTFVDPLSPFQGPEAKQLCPGGHKKRVTIHNVREYVSLAKQFILHDGVIAQAQAFRAGVDDFFSADFLRLFTPEELQGDVCGVGDNVDDWKESDIRDIFKLDAGKGTAEALVAVASIGGEGGAARRFSSASQTVGFLIKALLEASSKQRRQFLSFVTSVPIQTPGEIEVVPILSASGEFVEQDELNLPRANTCARKLYLPKCQTYGSFKQILWAVVEEESKFKGFYEWRGG